MSEILSYKHFFFIGIAGSGMSALAQYLADKGKEVSGSDRYFIQNPDAEIKKKLEKKNIQCFAQGEGKVDEKTQIVVVSSAIEGDVYEYKTALELNIPIIMRSDLLAEICNNSRTIAVAGTSGKSTVTAMIYEILEKNNLSPSLITGAGLNTLTKNDLIGNAVCGESDILVAEIDESDGSIVKYKPETGIILNIHKDHKSIEELEELFETFANNTKSNLVVNRDDERCVKFSKGIENDFSYRYESGFKSENFSQKDFNINFTLDGAEFNITQPGMYNMENATAATAACSFYGINPQNAAKALESYEGIHRRMNYVGNANGIHIIDDYAHNPHKLSAVIKACSLPGSKLFVWFQPHGFGPLKLMKDDFVKEIDNSLLDEDEVYFSDVYFAGGTVNKEISSEEVISGLRKRNRKAFYIPDRNNLAKEILPKLKKGDIILLTGARDPKLEEFAKKVFTFVKSNFK